MMYVLKDLKVWKKAIDLSLEVYRETLKFPKHELYGMTSQMRTCLVSIPSNIAEEAGRDTKADFSRFLCIARGSAYELQTQLFLSMKLNSIIEQIYEQLLTKLAEILKMLTGLQNALKTKGRR